MAHSFVMAHDDEEEAFRAYLRQFGATSILLVDTYDTVEGTRRAVAAMRSEGIVARAIRLDSGDLGALAVEARATLDDAGFDTVQILASGDLDEARIGALVAAGAPIDAFGVGTRLGTSADAPYLGLVYKLVEQGGQPRLKLSPGKHTLPGRKQVWRTATGDVLARDDEPGPPGGRPLLVPVFDGAPTGAVGSLADARRRCAEALAAREGANPAGPTSVRISVGLTRLASSAALAHG